MKPKIQQYMVTVAEVAPLLCLRVSPSPQKKKNFPVAG